MTTVYALVDPFTNEPRYVGMTVKSLAVRLDAHCKTGSNGVMQWVSSLNGTRPEIIALEENVVHDEDESEKFWIAYFKALGANLLNVREGGRYGAVNLPVKSNDTPRPIKFDEGKWNDLVKLARERGTTAAALIRCAVYSMLKEIPRPLEETP